MDSVWSSTRSCARRSTRRQPRTSTSARGTSPPGCVAGVAASWHGKVRGRTIVELRVRWKKGTTLEPDWPIDFGYLIEIDGRPTIRTKLDILPPDDFQGTTFADFMALGMILTAMPAINAIPAVVAAPPGIVTYTDVPLPLPRGLVPDRA